MKAFSQFMICATLMALLLTLPVKCAHAGSPTTPPDPYPSHLILSFGPTLNGDTNPKMGGIGYEKVLGESSLLAECRAIFESQLNGACSLVFSARVETISGLYMRLGAGPAWYFREDDRVSSHFNFNLQGAVGLTQDGFDVGVAYWHYSNAGLWPPNLGRDFIGPVIEIRL